ncbi:hypothetical protein LCGC14_0236210 [marine sediment metagenome]|uniref:Uncharacterized protein n=1 Tax=marine sediment metagenome TaxID=412755 RepID=A0A0F9U9B1_9ZZZZ
MTIKPRLIEMLMNNPPKGMESWQMYRIEYGEGLPEGTIWLREHMSPQYIEDLLGGMVEGD